MVFFDLIDLVFVICCRFILIAMIIGLLMMFVDGIVVNIVLLMIGCELDVGLVV